MHSASRSGCHCVNAQSREQKTYSLMDVYCRHRRRGVADIFANCCIRGRETCRGAMHGDDLPIEYRVPGGLWDVVLIVSCKRKRSCLSGHGAVIVTHLFREAVPRYSVRYAAALTSPTRPAQCRREGRGLCGLAADNMHVEFDTDAHVHCHSTRPNLTASLCVAVLSYTSVTVESREETCLKAA